MISILLLFLFIRWDDILFAEKNQTHKHYFHAFYFACVWSWETWLLATAHDCVDLFKVQILWYVHCLLESWVQDRQRSDFAMMMAHHVLAVVLIVGAFWTNNHQIGLVVLVEQDFADIIINICKIIHKSVSSATVHSVCIVILAISWFMTRIVLLGMIIVWSASFTTYKNWGLLALLCVLWYMQMVWGLRISRLAWTHFQYGVIQDE